MADQQGRVFQVSKPHFAANRLLPRQKASRTPALAFLLLVGSLTLSTVTAASPYWNLYCKQSGVSNANANCIRATPTEWLFSGGSFNHQVHAYNMSSLEAVTGSMEAQINDRSTDACSPATVTPEGDWLVSISNNGREEYYIPLYIETGVSVPDGGCELVGSTFGNEAEKSRTFFCWPGEQGPYLGVGDERFCVAYQPDQCPNTPHPVTIANGEKHFRNLVDAPVLGQFLFDRSYSSRESYAGYGLLNPPREQSFTAGWRLSYEAKVIHTSNSAGTNDVYTVAIPGKTPLSFLEQSPGQFQAKQSDAGSLTRLDDGGFLFRQSSATLWQFDAQGLLQGIHKASGAYVTLDYDTQGRLAGATDAYGRRLQLVLDGNGALDQVITPSGKVFRYQLDDMGRLEAV